VAVRRPPLGGGGYVPRRDAGPISRSTTRQPGVRYTITHFTERDLPDAECGSYSRHASAIDDSWHAGVVASRRWPHPGGKQLCVVLEAGVVLDPLIDARVAGFEVISVTQLTTRRLLISLAGESPWHFDYSASRELLLVVANDGSRTDYGRFLIKRFDPRTRHLSIVAVLEPDGPAARWAATVVPGEPVAAVGPREDPKAEGTSLRVHRDQVCLDSLGTQLDIPGPECLGRSSLRIISV
jgi:Siderophore-interacting FAD-binding domain